MNTFITIINIFTFGCILTILILNFKIKKNNEKIMQNTIKEMEEIIDKHNKALDEIEHAINERKKI